METQRLQKLVKIRNRLGHPTGQLKIVLHGNYQTIKPKYNDDLKIIVFHLITLFLDS